MKKIFDTFMSGVFIAALSLTIAACNGNDSDQLDTDSVCEVVETIPMESEIATELVVPEEKPDSVATDSISQVITSLKDSLEYEKEKSKLNEGVYREQENEINKLTHGLPIAFAIGLILGAGIMLIVKRGSKKKTTKAKFTTLTTSDKNVASFLKNHSINK